MSETTLKELLTTREDEDEEGADSSNDTDDLTHVRHKHGGQHSDANPHHSESDSAAALKGMRDDSSPMSLKTQNQVEDDGPAPEIHRSALESQVGLGLGWCSSSGGGAHLPRSRIMG